ncbi:hypothetical protein CEE39_06035 [bacterium (candidate division B38) B3_B38]|nr:MAG: hypothetical protein CEE39_06035 [bacterium (candidate division B38) B3_B38]
MGFAKHREFLPISRRVLVCCVAASIWLVAFSPISSVRWYKREATIVERQIKKEKLESIFDVIRHRRSVREYDSAPVPEEDIRLILDMAHYAPTAGNVQPWRFLIIKEKENLQRLHQALMVGRFGEKEESAARAREKCAGEGQAIHTKADDRTGVYLYLCRYLGLSRVSDV